MLTIGQPGSWVVYILNTHCHQTGLVLFLSCRWGSWWIMLQSAFNEDYSPRAQHSQHLGPVFKRSGYLSLLPVASVHQPVLVTGQLLSPWHGHYHTEGVWTQAKEEYFTFPGHFASWSLRVSVHYFNFSLSSLYGSSASAGKPHPELRSFPMGGLYKTFS